MQAIDISELVRQTMMVLVLIIVAAKFGGEVMGRLGQPPVLGELLMGVVLGNLGLFGVTLLDPLKNSPSLGILAEIGAILLLFEVGVESDLVQLLAVGRSSLLVATLGVIAPMSLGYIVSSQLIPGANWLNHLFVGGTLTATSGGNHRARSQGSRQVQYQGSAHHTGRRGGGRCHRAGGTRGHQRPDYGGGSGL
jgi:Kef-type K+ transport system membrane component KefB